jgi:hypothetical protein
MHWRERLLSIHGIGYNRTFNGGKESVEEGTNLGCRPLALYILPHQGISGVLAWKNMPDRNTFMDTTTLNCDSIVGVYLYDWKGTNTNEVQFLSVRNSDVNLVMYLIFVRNPFGVSPKQAIVDFRLSMTSKSQKICLQWNVQEHVAIKDESTGRKVTK